MTPEQAEAIITSLTTLKVIGFIIEVSVVSMVTLMWLRMYRA